MFRKTLILKIESKRPENVVFEKLAKRSVKNAKNRIEREVDREIELEANQALQRKNKEQMDNLLVRIRELQAKKKSSKKPKTKKEIPVSEDSDDIWDTI